MPNNFFKKIQEKSDVFPIVLCLLALLAVVSYFAYTQISHKEKTKVVKVVESPFKRVSVSAKSAYVLDVTTNTVLYDKNSTEPRPLASLTKVMTALTVEMASPGLQNIIVDRESIETQGDSYLFAGETWTKKNLLDYSLIVSSNDGASAIAGAAGALINGTSSTDNRQVFIEKMNSIASSIGLTNSKFMNEHGLDKDLDHVGAYGSAQDMATLFKYIIERYPHLLEATQYSNLTIMNEEGKIYNASNTDTIVNMVPSILASKTGFTDLAGGNLVIAFDAGLQRPVIISVLGSTQEGRFEDVLQLVGATMQYINK